MKQKVKNKALALVLTIAALAAGTARMSAETVTFTLNGNVEQNGTVNFTVTVSGSASGSVSTSWNYGSTSEVIIGGDDYTVPGGFKLTFHSDQTGGLIAQGSLQIQASGSSKGYIRIRHKTKNIYHVTLYDDQNRIICLENGVQNNNNTGTPCDYWEHSNPDYKFQQIQVKKIEVEYADYVPLSGAVIEDIADSYILNDEAALTPVPKIYWHGKLLTNNHYTLSYTNNTTAGTATVTATGTGMFSGTVSKQFQIVYGSYKIGCGTGTVSVTTPAQPFSTEDGTDYYRPGQAVSFTYTPPAGYIFTSLTVKRDDTSESLTVTEANGTYTFTLPASDVTVYPVVVPVSGSCGDNLTYALTDTDNNGTFETLTITGTGDMTAFGSSNFPWYNNRSEITTLHLPDGLTSISAMAFYYCTSLTSVAIPNSVTTMGTSVFYGCTNLNSVTLGTGITSISNSTFYNCSKLTEISLPNSVTSIGNSAFYNCSKLTEISLPNSVTSIGNSAFYHCSKLTEINIPNSVTSIGTSAFNGSGLTSVTIPNQVTTIPNKAFYNCAALEQVSLPASVTAINQEAFSGCSALQVINIPNSVTSIGNYAFQGSGLTSVTIPNQVTTIPEGAFKDCTAIAVVFLPESVTAINKEAFSGCSALQVVCSLHQTPPTLGVDVFNGCAIEVVYVQPGSMDAYKRTTGWILFSDNYLPYDGATSGTCNGDNNSNVSWELTDNDNDGINEHLIISGSGRMTDFDKAPWYNYASFIKTVEISDGVTNIGSNAFRYCIRLSSVNIPASVTEINYAAFEYCENLSSITIPGNVKVIREFAFRNCYGLTSVTIEDGVEHILDYAFAKCHITSIVYPNSVQYIGREVNSHCEHLTSVTLPEGLTEIKYMTFIGCSALSEITLPNSLTAIGQDAFYQCSALKEIVIPAKVTSIGTTAFAGDSQLKTVRVLNTSAPEIGDSPNNVLFDYCDALTSIVVPAASVPIYLTYNGWKDYADKIKAGYTISLAEGTNHVTLPPNLFMAGETATFTLTPDEGYAISSVRIGNTVLTPTSGNTYTYTMPAEDVTVSVKFALTLADNDDNTTAISNHSGLQADVTLEGRTLYKDGDWNTLCLPFDVTLSGSVLDGDNVEVRTLSSTSFDSSKGELTLNFTPATGEGVVTQLKAGTPYIIKWDGDGTNNLVNPVFANVSMSNDTEPVSTNYVDFIGTYAPEVYGAGTAHKDVLVLGGDNSLYYPDGAAATTIKAFRAYFQLKGITAGDPADPASTVKAFVLNFDGTETGISLTPDNARDRDGANEAWYTVDGRKLNGKPTQRGIYVKNGKKVTVK